jgi:hypothetical protein
MIEWFDDLALGMRFKTGEVTVTTEDIKMPVRPEDVLHVEGEVAEPIPSRTRPQGIAKVKWTAGNRRGEAVSPSRRSRSSPVALILRRLDCSLDYFLGIPSVRHW